MECEHFKVKWLISVKTRFLRVWESMDISNHSILSSPRQIQENLEFSHEKQAQSLDSWKHIPKIFLIFRANEHLSTSKLKLKRRTRVRGAVVTCL